MLACGLLLLPVLLLGSAGAGSLRYDQTQTGDTNIHLQIKNVEVLALLDDSAGAEHIAESTRKTTATASPTVPATGQQDVLNGEGFVTDITDRGFSAVHEKTYDYDYNDFTEKPPKPGPAPNVTFPTDPPPAAANTTITVATATATAAAAVTTDTEQPLLSSTTTPASTTTKKTRRCGAGFYRDTMGRCRRIRRPHLQTLMKLMRAQTTEMSKMS